MQSLDARWNSIGEQEPVTILSMSGDNDVKRVMVMMILMMAATCANIVNIRCNEDGDGG